MKNWKGMIRKQAPLALVTLILAAATTSCGVAIPTRPDVGLDSPAAPASAMNASTTHDGGDGTLETPDGDPAVSVLPSAGPALEVTPQSPSPAPWVGGRWHQKKNRKH
jgi:hypothetical protein